MYLLENIAHWSLKVLKKSIDFGANKSFVSFDFNVLEESILTMIKHILQQKPPYDANKLYCSEILSILLQNTEGKSNIKHSIFYF